MNFKTFSVLRLQHMNTQLCLSMNPHYSRESEHADVPKCNLTQLKIDKKKEHFQK